MLTVDEARARILSAFAPLTPVNVPLSAAFGRVLAQDVVASENLPPFRNSAMDGYAVRSGDTIHASGESPATLPVVEEIAAGDDGMISLSSGSAIRIMTGAPVPNGADAVVRFEDVEVMMPGHESGAQLSSIVLARPVSVWENVRHPGEDVASGSLAIPGGTRIGAAEIGLLAALGCQTVVCHKSPRVTILATGDELVDVGTPRSGGQIRNSNSPILATLTRQFGAEPGVLGIARDSERDIINRLAEARDADLIVTSGGVSAGDYDLVKQVLRREGNIELWQVRMKPGKPLAFGRIGGTPLLGLPGNPGAAYVAYIEFGRPAIRRMLGLPESLPLVPARLTEDVENRGGRRHFVRAIIRREGHELVVRPVEARGSAALSTLVAANCLIVIPEQADRVLHGSIVDVQITGEEFHL